MNLFATPEAAVEAAEKEAAAAAANFVFYDFDGDEYCNDGNGDCSWDGISRRCECGNRRVSWESEMLFREDGKHLYYAAARAF